MQLGKVRSPPIFGIIGLAAAILVLTYSGAIQESFADTGVGFIKRGSLVDRDPIRVGDVTYMVHLKIGETNYLVSASNEGAHLVLVDNTGSLSAVNATGHAAWGTIKNIATYESGSDTYIAAVYSNISGTSIRQGVKEAIQIFSITGDSQLTQNSSNRLADTKLDTVGGIETYSPTAGKYYAVTTGGLNQQDSYVNIIDITNPNTQPSIVATLQDSNSIPIRGGNDLDIYTVNNKYYAVIAAHYISTVTILDITTPTNPVVVGKISDSADSVFDYPSSLEIYSTGGKYYAVVTSTNSTNAGIQILDITDPTNPVAAGKLQANTGDKRYVNALELALHSYNDRWYALLIGKKDYNSLQIIDITDPNMPEESSYIRPAAFSWGQAKYVESLVIGERHFVGVGTIRHQTVHSGIHSLELAFLTADAGSNQTRTYGQTVTLNGAAAVTAPDKTFTYAWNQTGGTPNVNIPSNTLNPTFRAPNQDATLEFTLTVTLAADQGVITSDDTPGIITATDTVTITVSSLPPTVDAGRDRTFAPGSTVTLSGSGTDPDSETLQYEWTQTEGPDVGITGSTALRPTFTAPDDPTKLVFTLAVSDGRNSVTDDVTITIANLTRNIKELKDTLVQGQITEPTQSTDPDQVGGTDLITGSNEITMIYTEPIATFINSYLNFTISGEDRPRNITGINGSPAIETGETIRINGKLVKTYSTILTFDGPPVPPGSTGSMYVQHADYYLAKIQIRDGQN